MAPKKKKNERKERFKDQLRKQLARRTTVPDEATNPHPTINESVVTAAAAPSECTLQHYFEDQSAKQQAFEERRKQQKRDSITRKRSDSAFKEEEQIKDCIRIRKNRLDPDKRAIEREADRQARHLKRSSSAVRKTEVARETPARKKRRQDPVTRQHEAARETPSRKEKRQDPVTRQLEAARETPVRKKQRQDPVTREPEAARDASSRRGKRQDPVTRRHEAARETPSRKEKRQDPVTRQHEAARETPVRKKRRQDPVTREPEAARDASSRRGKRQDPVTRQHEAARETPSRKEKRQDPVTRQHEAARETPSRKEKRQDPVTRQHEAARETPVRKKRRQDPVTREPEAERDASSRRGKRQDPVTRQHEAANETPARKEKRQDPVTRQHEAARETPSRKEKRQDPVTRQHEAARETPVRKKRRQDPVTREPEAERDASSRRGKRQDPVTRQHEAARETPSRKEKRQDPVTRQHEAARETPSRKEKRQDPVTRQHEAARETPARKEKRLGALNYENAVDSFKKQILIGPVFVCTCCHRLLYQTSVSQFNKNQFSDMQSTLLTDCITGKVSNDGKEYICSSCKLSLKKNQMPVFAICNNMGLDEIPQQLQQLNSLEVASIARRIPFMKLLALPRGKQRCVHGCVVNVPVEPEESVSLLPRVPSSASMVMVKLKRKLQYRGHVFRQNICPQKILEALHILKVTLKNPLYENVLINDNWMEQCIEDSPDMWASLTSTLSETEPEAPQANSHSTSSSMEDARNEDESDSEDVEDERSRLSGLPFNSCIQPKDISTETNAILTIAPGEGKKPLSFISDAHSEEMSFPHLFPSGRFGYSMTRPKRITLKKYFQARLLNVDGRFARSIEYIFAAQYRCEAKDIQDCLSIGLRKGRQQNLNAGQLRDRIHDFTQSDLGIHFLQKVRGSPAYFNKMLYDLLGMIRQLGPCTWFVTLSAADLKWLDTIKIIAQQQGKLLTEEDFESLTWEQRCEFLRSNPVTAARHFDNRVQLFMKYVLLNKNLHPIGEITDYKYRIEFQHRGSPHVHMLVWVKDAPNFEENTEQEVAQFIDNHITCQLPEADENLKTLLSLVQKHTHSVACRKHGKTCRFKFPRPPVSHTLAVKPPEEQPSPAVQKHYSNTLQAVYDQLSKLDTNEEVTFEQLLHMSSVDETTYMEALKWIKTKNGQPAIVLKRSPSEVNINNYNAIMMNAWEANLDVQYVTNTFACVMYVASYVSKPEKTLGDVLKAVSSSAQHLGPKTSMKHVAKKFLTHREVSAQEAIYRLLSLPLVQGSRQVVFIPTDLPENRTRLMKPLKVIEALDDDDPDIFITSLLDRYSARPTSVDSICLAAFASSYKYASHSVQNDVQPHNSSDEEDAIIEDLPRNIHLQRGFGNMQLRRNPAIIRYHQWSVNKEPEQYYHAQLLLYFPWKDEKEDLGDDTHEASYHSNLEIILQNRSNYEHNADAVAQAVENLNEIGEPEESWHVLAPQTEQMQQEDEAEGPELLPDVLGAFDTDRHRSVNRDIGIAHYEVEFTTEKMTSQEWYNLLLSLNTLQTQVHDFVVHWCTQMLFSHKQKRPDPFHLFLTGGAGVGKSHLVRAIVQTVTRMFSRDSQSEDMHIMVCAPTGAAAYNISGYTLHAAFLLPIHVRHSDDYIPLSGEKLASLKEMIGSVKIVVIDEISMVGADMLLTVHRRLCDIMGNEEPFGGVSILAVGDLLQLPPVAQKPVFSTPSDAMAAIYGSLWQNHFYIVELEEIQRQKSDIMFASLLNRIRSGTYTEEDLEVLRNRKKDATDYQTQSTHVFAYNKDVNDHNSRHLETLPGVKFSFKSQDSTRDDQTGSVKTSSLKDKAGGLASTVTLAIGARVMLNKNLDVQDGLVNSASGIVTGFLPNPEVNQDTDTFKPKYILVKFDDGRVGKRSRLLSQRILPDDSSTPIPTVESQVRLGRYSKVTARRVQFPLCLAWAVTIHKEQGKTEDSLVVCCNGTFHVGQFYTAISRTKDLKGLSFLGDITSNKIKVNTNALQELRRMKDSSPFVPVTLNTGSSTVTSYTHFKIQCLNVNSLWPHKESIQKDAFIAESHITCFVETWLKPSDVLPDFQDHNCVRTDSKQRTQHRSGGLLMFIHHDLRLLRQYSVDNTTTEHQIVLLATRADPSLRLAVVSLYNSPRTTAKQFLPQLERIMSSLPMGLPTFIVGSKLDSSKSQGLKQRFREAVEELKRKENHLQALKAKQLENEGLMKHMNQSLLEDKASIERKIKLQETLLQEKGEFAAAIKYWESQEASSRISNAMEARLNADLAAQRRALDKERVALLAREKRTIRDMALVTEYEEVKRARHEARERRHEMMTQLSLYTAKINALKNQARFDEANFRPPTPLSPLPDSPNFRRQDPGCHGDTRQVTWQHDNEGHCSSGDSLNRNPNEVVNDGHTAAGQRLPAMPMVPHPPSAPRPTTRPRMVHEGKVTRQKFVDTPRNSAVGTAMNTAVGTANSALRRLQAVDAGTGNRPSGSLSDNKVTLPPIQSPTTANGEDRPKSRDKQSPVQQLPLSNGKQESRVMSFYKIMKKKVSLL